MTLALARKSKERREEPLGTMSYQTSSKRSPPFWLLIGARKLLCFSAQSEGSIYYFKNLSKSLKQSVKSVSISGSGVHV